MYYENDRNSKLEELKKKTRDLSNQQYQVRQAIDSKRRDNYELSKREDEINKEMSNLMSKMIASNNAIDIAEREKTNNRLDKISQYQRATNEQLATLNSYLKNTTSLEDLYATKRRELEYNYQEQEKTLQSRLNALNEDIDKKREELDNLVKQKRLKSFADNMGTVAIVVAFIIILILVIEWLGNGISGFFGSIAIFLNPVVDPMINGVKDFFNLL